MTPGLAIEPGPHWWEVSALITAPSLLHARSSLFQTIETWERNHRNQRNNRNSCKFIFQRNYLFEMKIRFNNTIILKCVNILSSQRCRLVVVALVFALFATSFSHQTFQIFRNLEAFGDRKCSGLRLIFVCSLRDIVNLSCKSGGCKVQVAGHCFTITETTQTFTKILTLG